MEGADEYSMLVSAFNFNILSYYTEVNEEIVNFNLRRQFKA